MFSYPFYKNFRVDGLLLRPPLLKSWLYAKSAHKQLSNLCITVTGKSLAELCTQVCATYFVTELRISPMEVSMWTSMSSLGFPGSILESVVWDIAVTYIWPLRPFVKLVD